MQYSVAQISDAVQKPIQCKSAVELCERGHQKLEIGMELDSNVV